MTIEGDAMATTTEARSFQGVTIDASHSRDLDDAVWVERDGEGWRVTVAIADVCGSVAIGSPEDVAARATAFTRYAATRTTRPMLPPRLSEQELTLQPGRTRDVLGIEIRLSANLAVTTSDIGFGTLRHRGRLSHEQASQLIDGHGEERLRAMMGHAWDLASRLLHKRRRGGAITFFSTASGLTTNEEGGLVDTGLHGPVSRAYIVVQELMILANGTMAETFAGYGVPLLYRNHRANPLADRTALREDVERVVDGTATGADAERARLGMMLGRATLGPTVTGHYGLNLPVYAWFTSPIRRYADLVNQRIVRAFLHGQPPPYEPDELGRVAHELNEAVRIDADERSDAFKRASERKAKRSLGREDFARLDATGFQAVIKAAFADGVGDVGEAMRTEALSRLGAGTLSAKDVARMMLSANAEHAAFKIDVLREMERQPAIATSVLNHLAQAHGLAGPTFEDATEGPTHAPRFRSGARATMGGATHATATMTATRQVEARHRAAVALLAAIGGPTWEPPAEWRPTEEPAAAVGTKASAAAPTSNAKGRLQELCQARRWPMPTYDVAQEGPPHAPRFMAIARIRTGANLAPACSDEATADSRKGAEHLAAASLLAKLGPDAGKPGKTR